MPVHKTSQVHISYLCMCRVNAATVMFDVETYSNNMKRTVSKYAFIIDV